MTNLIEGQIDHLGRPIVAVSLARRDLPALRCLIDTGFNRSLLMNRNRAREIGFRSFEPEIIASIATAHDRGSSAEVMSGDIIWFGQRTSVGAHTVSWDPTGSSEDSPDALLGAGLLRGLHVFLDYQFGRVVIQKPLPTVRPLKGK